MIKSSYIPMMNYDEMTYSSLFSSLLGSVFLMPMNPMNPNLVVWLVVFSHPSEKYDFVNGDDDIPNIWENKIDVPNHQSVVVYVETEVHQN